MEPRIEEDVDGWPSRPFDGGYDGLRTLASDEFSGAVRASGTWLFLVNGKVVGVFDGELEDVESGGGTVYKAPHPSLPLLYAMQEIGGETRAQYYTNDTPISEVDETLSSGFTGYVELSENVLSGDYYQLYHAGRSMSVAFVGNSGRMITGEEAFERADDEVGIYEVVDVDLEVIDLPEPPEDEGEEDADEEEGDVADAETDETEDAAESAAEAAEAAAEATASAAAATDATTDSGGVDDDPAEDAGDGLDQAGTSSGPTAVDADGSSTVDTSDDAADASAGADAGSTAAEASPTETVRPSPDEEATDRPEPAQSEETKASASRSEPTPDRGERSTSSKRDEASSDTPDRSSRSRRSNRSGSQGDGTDAGRSGSAREEPDRSDAGGTSGSEAGTGETTESERFESEEAWREATTVPPLDPDRSADDEQSAARSRRSASTSQNTRQRAAQRAKQREPSSRSGQAGQRAESNARQSAETQSSSGADRDDEDVSGTFEEEVLEREDRIDRLQQRISNVEDERDEIASERDQLAERVETLEAENESLRGQIESLERELEQLESAAASGGGAGGAGSAPAGGASGQNLAPRTALEGTDLFVRYDSKSEPTLDAAHDGTADHDAVNDNLRLDIHTQFEDEGATVEGEPFEAFLKETMAYRFVEWLVRELPFEIRDTGSASGLRDLYDALPEVDRVEFHGTVARESQEGESEAPNETFDVVVRDTMGDALFVANMNESRDPATGQMIVDLQEDASRVKESNDPLAAAFFVTRSFFEPKALETAGEATSASLLSRDSRKSFVKLSRKRGYHLCLVEARGEDLHLNVPEL